MKASGRWGKIDLPDIHPLITESKASGRVKHELRVKAAQVHTLFRISEDLFGPILDEASTGEINYRHDIGWRSWLAHIKVFNAMCAKTFTRAHRHSNPLLPACTCTCAYACSLSLSLSHSSPLATGSSILQLETLIDEHQALYAKVPNYWFRPKFHLARHVPGDIELMGPPRYYWCFSFEAFYRRVKKWITHSNRKSELMHAGVMLSLQTALALRGAWEHDVLTEDSEYSSESDDE